MFMWLGHCRHRSNPNKIDGPAVIYSDETVGSLKDFSKYERADFNRYNVTEDNQRLVIPAWSMSTLPNLRA
jgi:hypothetical protein